GSGEQVPEEAASGVADLLSWLADDTMVQLPGPGGSADYVPVPVGGVVRWLAGEVERPEPFPRYEVVGLPGNPPRVAGTQPATVYLELTAPIDPLTGFRAGTQVLGVYSRKPLRFPVPDRRPTYWYRLSGPLPGAVDLTDPVRRKRLRDDPRLGQDVAEQL